jgi:hypothetical protein
MANLDQHRLDRDRHDRDRHDLHRAVDAGAAATNLRRRTATDGSAGQKIATLPRKSSKYLYSVILWQILFPNIPMERI